MASSRVDILGYSVARMTETFCVSEESANSGVARDCARLPQLARLYWATLQQGSGNRPPTRGVVPARERGDNPS
jgi:hypothetical protein